MSLKIKGSDNTRNKVAGTKKGWLSIFPLHNNFQLMKPKQSAQNESQRESQASSAKHSAHLALLETY